MVAETSGESRKSQLDGCTHRNGLHFLADSIATQHTFAYFPPVHSISTSRSHFLRAAPNIQSKKVIKPS